MIQKVTVKSWKSYEQHTPKGNEKMKKQEQQKNGCRERSLTSISRRVSSGAMLVALAMIFSYVESLIPINLGVPGIKLGVANLVTVTGLYILAPMEVLLVVILRVLLVGFMFGNGMSILYSLAGAALSMTVMTLMLKKTSFSLIGVSVAGGVSHNIGQLIIAMLIVQNASVFVYAPALLVAGVAAGVVIGGLTNEILKRVHL
jgi:heptaprenyl diphosphate synthase